MYYYNIEIDSSESSVDYKLEIIGITDKLEAYQEFIRAFNFYDFGHGVITATLQIIDDDYPESDDDHCKTIAALTKNNENY